MESLITQKESSLLSQYNMETLRQFVRLFIRARYPVFQKK